MEGGRKQELDQVAPNVITTINQIARWPLGDRRKRRQQTQQKQRPTTRGEWPSRGSVSHHLGRPCQEGGGKQTVYGVFAQACYEQYGEEAGIEEFHQQCSVCWNNISGKKPR
jgi:hypothetical protein